MDSKTLVIGTVAVIVGAFAIPAYGHHSYAMFDEESEITLEGTVEEFQWTNPHGWVHINVANEQGENTLWAIETGSPASLFRQGWRPDTIVQNDQVTFTFNPLRNGEPGGNLSSIVLPDGTVMD